MDFSFHRYIDCHPKRPLIKSCCVAEYRPSSSDIARRFAKAMKERGVLISMREATSFRAVTHRGIARGDIDRAVAAAAQAAGEVFGD